MKIDAQIEAMSLVGVGVLNNSEYPMSFGNYFSFSNEVRCVNMWAENFKEATSRFLSDGKVEIDLFQHNDHKWAIVVDERIPKDWLNDSLYFTGHWIMPKGMLNIVKDRYGLTEVRQVCVQS